MKKRKTPPLAETFEISPNIKISMMKLLDQKYQLKPLKAIKPKSHDRN